MEEISQLAEILRENGHKISNSTCKFTLPTDLLNYLNSSFNLILERREAFTSSFHVLNNTNEENEKYRDLHFLYDFIQLAKSLKLTKSNQITPSAETQQEFTNISKFKELSLLEIYKVNIKTILGISLVRSKLQYLICERCLKRLNDVLELCGADKCEGQMWCNLKEATFKHNNIEVIDDSIKYVPWLTTLDLSNNAIEDASPLSFLLNLKYLNLSFNKLTMVPLFIGQICKRLQVLVLHNNFIESIESVVKLVNLQQLDLMENCLLEHKTLLYLRLLAALQYLNLNGNPLSYHPQHRNYTIRYLHTNTTSFKFILDDVPLSKSEQHFINEFNHKPINIENSLGSTSAGSGADFHDRSIRIREAVIEDVLENDNIMDMLECSNTFSEISVTPAESKANKEIMASLHKDYIQILYDKAGVSTTEALKVPFFIESHQQPLSSTPLGEDILNAIDEIVKNNDTTAPYVTASDTFDKEVDETEKNIYEQKLDQQNTETEQQTTELSDDEELECGEDNIFAATVKNGNDIVLILTKTHIVEKDVISTKALGRFTLDSLSVCDIMTDNDVQYVHLMFETLHKNSCRDYLLEQDEAKDRLFNKLREIINNRPPKEISNLFKCMKCSTQFGIEDEKTLHKEETVCPVCGSNLVFEEDH